MGKLKAGMKRNKNELELLDQSNQGNALAGTTNQTQVARAMQLTAYLRNQKKALEQCEGQKKAIEAKYKLQEMKATAP